jgi:endoglucanase Acf2
LSVQLGYGQALRDFKKKTETNAKERTFMLDLLRTDIKNNLEQDVIFVVNHFKVYGNYAWMEGTVQRKDGKELKFPDEAYDCCHVEALFKKVNGSWILKENGAFSTDVWYACIVSSYLEASRQIFSERILSSQENCTD